MTQVQYTAPPGLLELGLGFLFIGLLLGVLISRRTRPAALTYWTLGWVLLAGLGAARFAAIPIEIEFPLAALFSGLMLAGARRYARRSIPAWLFPVVIGVGMMELVLAQTGNRAVADLSKSTFEPALLVVAGVITLGVVRARRAAGLHRLMPLGFFAIASLHVFFSFFPSTGPEAIGAWLAVTAPVATIQLWATFDLVRTRTEEVSDALARSVSELEATLESTADGLLVVDLEGRYARFNRSFGEMWHIPSEILDQRTSETALKYSMEQLVDPEAFYEKVKSLYADPEAESFDTLEFKDGRVFERYSRPQRVGDEVVGRVWSFRDVSERKRAEAVAARHQDHLADLVKERTRELVASRDRLRRADRLAAVGTLAAGVAHQINNPIGAILNSAEYALLCEEDADVHATWKSALQVNVTESRRCAEIVRSMLQFANERPVHKQVEELNHVVRRAFRAVGTYAREHGAEMTMALCEGPLPVLMSPIEIEQVIINLLHNGIESRDRDAHVDVVTTREGGLARIFVIDDGTGIDAEHQPRLFDPFFSTRVLEGGTGLGLSVAHGIVSDHRGEILVESEGLKGSRFVIELPIAESVSDSTA